MSKNIVLCSDGTGNSGGKAGEGTNVWKTYRTVHVHLQPPQPEQMAFHDDGVGTQSNKLFKVLAGATGLGLSRNIRQLYNNLVHHYAPGDNIYLFGFSRGAFTVRSLAGLISLCGVIDQQKLDRPLDDSIGEAFSLYWKVHRTQDWTITQDFRRKYAHRHPDDPANSHRFGGPGCKDEFDVPIKFIGVWDTVGAIGLPIAELTDAADKIFRFKFHKEDLLACVEHGYHALAIDDERHSFHPVIWDEASKKDYQVLEQVWFSGVHSNIGGGYPKDQMALVALAWMLDKAAACGLRFRDELRQQFELEANVHGKLYNSRAGFAVYYRYRPRNIEQLLKEKLPAGAVPKIHATVFDRVQRATSDYAPANIPAKYEVVEQVAGSRSEPPQPPEPEVVEQARDLIFLRRGMYFAFLTLTLGLVYAGIRLSSASSAADPQVGWFFLGPLFSLASWATPAIADGWIAALRNNPFWLLLFLVLFVSLITARLRIKKNQIGLCVAMWKGKCDPQAQRFFPRLSRLVRTSKFFKETVPHFQTNVLPWLVLLAVPAGIAWWLWPTAAVQEDILGAEPGCGLSEVATPLDVGKSRTIEFDTRCPGLATDVIVEAGHSYKVEVETTADWFDHKFPASPAGLSNAKDAARPIMRLSVPFRRALREPWYSLLGSVGNDGKNQFNVGAGQEDLDIDATGRLYFYVNDVVCYFCPPGPWFFYDSNNHGTATITVTALR
ncbi:MAG: DUF2235 domain-containing protein [Gammaproteobacteria bacterium]|nr:DUF2235 domain-containing protein [Gammaproteobacteria bacterium]